MLVARLAKVPYGLVVWFVCLAPLPAASAPLFYRAPPLNRNPSDVQETQDLITQLDRPIAEATHHQHVDPTAAQTAATQNEPMYWYPPQNGPRPYVGHVYVAPHGARNRDAFATNRMGRSHSSSNTPQHLPQGLVPGERARKGTFDAAAASAATGPAQVTRPPYVLESAFAVPGPSTRPPVAHQPSHAPASLTAHVQLDPDGVAQAASALSESLRKDGEAPRELEPVRTVSDVPDAERKRQHAKKYYFASQTTARLMRAYLQAKFVEWRQAKGLPQDGREVELVTTTEEGMDRKRLKNRIFRKILKPQEEAKPPSPSLRKWGPFEVDGFFVGLNLTPDQKGLDAWKGYVLYSVAARPDEKGSKIKGLSVGVYAIPDKLTTRA